MTAVLLLCMLADQDDEQLELLRVFRREFIAVTPGEGRFPHEFAMGESVEGGSPQHKVKFNHHFHIAKYEVPQNLWESVMGSNPSRWKGPRNSVEMLNLKEAKTFCRKVTQLMRSAKLIDDGQEIRLPSEAEWEYAARAATKTIYSFGNSVEQLGAHAWYTDNASGNDPPVGAKKPNPWGLYDIHGYLWEWCLDSWHDDYQGAPTDGTARAPDAGKFGIVRGGSWKDKADKLTSSFRQRVSKQARDDAVGLRCVLAEVGN